MTAARLLETSPYYKIFPHGVVPVVSIFAQLGRFENAPDEDFYFGDVSKWTDEQIAQVADAMAQLNGNGLPSEAEEYIRTEKRLPLRVQHVASVMTDALWFL